MSGAISTGSGSGISQTWASHRTISADPNAATMGKTSSSVADLTSFSRPTRIPRPKAIIAPVGVGSSISTSPRVMTPCPNVRTIQPSTRTRGPDLVQAFDPGRGVERAIARLSDEPVERGDLIEPQSRARIRRQVTRASEPTPVCTTMAVGSTTKLHRSRRMPGRPRPGSPGPAWSIPPTPSCRPRAPGGTAGRCRDPSRSSGHGEGQSYSDSEEHGDSLAQASTAHGRSGADTAPDAQTTRAPMGTRVVGCACSAEVMPRSSARSRPSAGPPSRPPRDPRRSPAR